MPGPGALCERLRRGFLHFRGRHFAIPQRRSTVAFLNCDGHSLRVRPNARNAEDHGKFC